MVEGVGVDAEGLVHDALGWAEIHSHDNVIEKSESTPLYLIFRRTVLYGNTAHADLMCFIWCFHLCIASKILNRTKTVSGLLE